MFQDILLTIRPEIENYNQKIVREVETPKKLSEEELKKGLKILAEFEEANTRSKNKEGLPEFKRKVHQVI